MMGCFSPEGTSGTSLDLPSGLCLNIPLLHHRDTDDWDEDLYRIALRRGDRLGQFACYYNQVINRDPNTS